MKRISYKQNFKIYNREYYIDRSGYFFIRTRLNPQLVCDINGDNASHGERVITYHMKHPPADNQLWYEDAATGTYRSKKNPNLCLAAGGMLIK